MGIEDKVLGGDGHLNGRVRDPVGVGEELNIIRFPRGWDIGWFLGQQRSSRNSSISFHLLIFR